MMKFKKRKKRSNSRGYTLKGVVDHVNKKYAFIEIDEFSEDIKVRSRHLKGAIHGDKVEVRVSRQMSKRNLEGEVIKILERKTTDFIGTVEDSKGFAFFIPKNKKVFVDFFIRKKRSEKFSKKKKPHEFIFACSLTKNSRYATSPAPLLPRSPHGQDGCNK